MTQENQTPELLPCPFCGAKPVEIEAVNNYPVEAWCDTDDCIMNGTSYDIKDWNTRAPSPERAERVSVNVGALKATIYPKDNDYDAYWKGGWNACIDHLSANGYLSSPERAEPVSAGNVNVLTALGNLYATASSAWPSAEKDRHEDYYLVLSALSQQATQPDAVDEIAKRHAAGANAFIEAWIEANGVNKEDLHHYQLVQKDEGNGRTTYGIEPKESPSGPPVRFSKEVEQAAKDCAAKRREQKLVEALRYYANGEYIADQTYVGDKPRDFCKYHSQKVAREALENYRKMGGE